VERSLSTRNLREIRAREAADRLESSVKKCHLMSRVMEMTPDIRQLGLECFLLKLGKRNYFMAPQLQRLKTRQSMPISIALRTLPYLLTLPPLTVSVVISALDRPLLKDLSTQPDLLTRTVEVSLKRFGLDQVSNHVQRAPS
jgi:hypothetical protein